MTFKLRELDAIRGIAIILIVFFHMQYFIKPWPDWSLYGAMIGVGLFFFISGYVLYLAHPTRITDVRTFCKKRLMRIYPLFTIAFIVSFLQDPSYLNLPPQEIIGYYLNINNILQPRYMLILTGYWFIGALLLCYISFIIINRYFTNSLSIFFLGSIILLTMIGIRQFFGIIPTRMLAFFCVFVLGILATRINLFNPANKKYALPAFITIVLMYTYSFYNYGFFFLDDMPTSYGLTPYIISIAQILLFGFVCYALFGFLPSLIRDSLCKVGFAAFAIYLFHMSVFWRLPSEYYLLGLPLSIIIGYYTQKLEVYILKRKIWATAQ